MRSSLCEDRIPQKLQAATASTARNSRRCFGNQPYRSSSSSFAVDLFSSSGLRSARLLRPGRLALQARGPGRPPLRPQGRAGLHKSPGAARAGAQREGRGGQRKRGGRRQPSQNRVEARPARGPRGLVVRPRDPPLLRAREGISGGCRGRGGELRGSPRARGGEPWRVLQVHFLLFLSLSFLAALSLTFFPPDFFIKFEKKKQTSKGPPLTRSVSASPPATPSRSPPTPGTAPTRRTRREKREAGSQTTAGAGASPRRWPPPRRPTRQTSRRGGPPSGSTTSGRPSWARRCCWGCLRRGSGRTATPFTKVRKERH